MKKKLLLLIAATLLSTGGGIHNSDSLSNEFAYFTNLDSNEMIGKQTRFAVATPEEIAGTTDFIEGESTYISSAYAQVSEDNSSIRFVAALKGDSDNGSLVVNGHAGFHIKYTKGEETIDKHLKVNNYYLSMKAGDTWYAASELSTYYNQDGVKKMSDFLAPKSFEDQGYNLFVALDVKGIDADNIDTLIEVQPYFVNSDGISYSKYSKLSSAIGYEEKFIVINGEKTKLTKNDDSYSITSLKLETGDEIHIVDSYGIPVTNFSEELTNGKYIAPKNGQYNFTLSNSQVTVVKPLTGSTITLENYDENNLPNALENSEITLPTIKVVDEDSIDQTDNVNVSITDLTDSSATISAGKLTSSKTGTHEVKYTITDKRTNEVIGEKTINVKVYLKLLKVGKGSSVCVIDNELSDNPSLRITDHGIFCASFNFEPSKNYYAEFEMAKFDSWVANQMVTFSHNTAGNGDPTKGAYYEGFKFNDSSWETATSKYVTGWDLHAFRMWSSANMISNRYRNPGVDLSTKSTKVAIARVGSNFYYFYNDVLINVSQYEELENVNTMPGMLAYGKDGTNTLETSFSNFNFIKDEEAVKTKVNSLTTNLFDYYLAWDNSTSFGSAEFDGNSFKFKNEEKVLTNNTYNQAMVTPLVNLCGSSWQVDFDLKVDALGDSDKWGKIILDLRTVHDKKCVMELMNTFGSAGTLYEIVSHDLYGTPDPALETNFAKGITEDFTREMTLHYTIKLTTSGTTENYQVTIYDKANTDHTYTFTQSIAYSDSYYQSPKNLVFKSQKFAGTISNFEYKS